MIALRHTLPLVRNAEGIAMAFECTWLRLAVQDAARDAGYHSWWLVDDLVAGVSLYLRNCYVKTVIDLPELEHVVRAALRNIGYEEVAARFRALPPTPGISLVQCLQNTSAGSGSTFFEKLGDALTRLYQGETRYFRFYDLHACADQLQNEASGRRGSKHECLREKIVSFVREHVHAQGQNHQVWCSIT